MQISRKRFEVEAWYQVPTNRKWPMADCALSRPVNLGHANGVIAVGTAGIVILRVLTVTFVYISAQPPLRS